MNLQTTSERDRGYLNLFRAAVHRLRESGNRSDEKSARAFYDELSLSAQFDAEIFLAELGNGSLA